MKITAALLLAVSLIRLTSAQPLAAASPAAPAGKPGTVDGLVTNSVTGDPLRKAVVTLQGVGQIGAFASSETQVTTDAAGRFHFGEIAPGSYLIRAEREGFMALHQRVAKTIKVGDEENVKDVTVALLPLARVSGHVYDEDGDPIMLAGVQALHYGYNQGRKTLMPGAFATSNDLGEFEFQGLEPGRYFLIANARPPVQNLPPRTRVIGQLSAYPQTFYPSATAAAQATAMALAPGAALSNIDFRLRKVPAFHIRGKLVDAAGQPARNIFVNLMDDDRSFGSRQGASTANDGAFDLAAVVPGTYLLLARLGQSDSAREPITVTDQDLNGVQLTLSSGFALAGHFGVDGVVPPQMNSQINVVSADGSFQQFSGRMEQDGTFSVDNVRPGSYLLWIFVGAQNLYVKSIRFGDTDVSNGLLTLTQGNTGSLNIVLGTDGGQVQGTIQSASGASGTAGIVSLFPAGDLPGRRDLVKHTGIDSFGGFKFQDVAPGEYEVFAWEGGLPELADVPEFRKAIESRAASVTVQAGGHESVQVQVIPADDVEAEKNKLQ